MLLDVLTRSITVTITILTFPSSLLTAAKDREKAEKLAAQKKVAEASSRAASPAPSYPTKKGTPKGGKKAGSAGTPLKKSVVDQRDLDMQGLNLGDKEEDVVDEPPPKMSLAREKVLEEAKKAIEDEQKSGKKGVSLVVIGTSAFYFVFGLR